jgi:lipopolysaccharide export system protein LptA
MMRTESLLRLLFCTTGLAICVVAGCLSGPAWAQNAGGFDMGSVLGGEGGSFDVLRADLQEFETDEKTGDLVKYTADGKFRYRSKDLDLDCDHLVYTAAKGLLVATGSPCKIRKDKTDAECRQFEYATKENRMILKGDPYILDKRDNQIVKTWAKTITFVKTPDGRTRTILDTGKSSSSAPGETGSAPPPDSSKKAVIDIRSAPKEKPAASAKKSSAPVKLDAESKLDKIPAVDIDE